MCASSSTIIENQESPWWWTNCSKYTGHNVTYYKKYTNCIRQCNVSIYRYVPLLANQLRFPYTIIYNMALLSKGKTIWLPDKKMCGSIKLRVHAFVTLILDRCVQLHAPVTLMWHRRLAERNGEHKMAIKEKILNSTAGNPHTVTLYSLKPSISIHSSSKSPFPIGPCAAPDLLQYRFTFFLYSVSNQWLTL
jgi:hypothetical protein